MRKYNGKILERTKFDPNRVIILGKTAKLELYNIKHEIVGHALIDTEDLDRVGKFKWSFRKDGYVWSSYLKMYLHHFILEIKPIKGKLVVDHVNRDKLDNRRENLRTCTHLQNCYNQDISGRNSSGYKGVTWDKDENMWRSQIWYDKRKFVDLGFYEDIKDAAMAYNEGAIKYHGEYACLNIIEK